MTEIRRIDVFVKVIPVALSLALMFEDDFGHKQHSLNL